MTARTNSRQRLRSRPRRPLQGATDLLPKKPRIRLRHGQAIWLLTELGYRGAASRDTFYEYIKSLRKIGIPFGREKFVTKHRGRRLAGYSYCHLMELAIALSLRVYHVGPIPCSEKSSAIAAGYIASTGKHMPSGAAALEHRLPSLGMDKSPWSFVGCFSTLISISPVEIWCISVHQACCHPLKHCGNSTRASFLQVRSYQ